MMLILNVWQERCYFYHKLMFLHIGQDLEEDKHSTQQTNITFKEIGWTAQIGLTSLARLRHVIKVPCLCLFFFFSQTEMDLENHRCIVSKQKVLLFFCVKVYWYYATHALHYSNNYFPTAILFDYKNSKAHKLKKHQPQNSKTQKPKLLFLFYKNTLFFAPF